LEQLANTIAQHGLGSPSVIVVGEVVRGLAALHDQSTPILTRYQAV
jgi:siroheme synthase